MRAVVELTGSLESLRSSQVASEVAGLVVDLVAREGDMVRRGAPVARLRRETAALRLASAEGQLNEARARMQLAEASRARADQLFAEKVISVQQLDEAVGEFEAQRGRVSQLEAEVERLRDELNRTTVRAPFTGAVTAEYTAEGAWIGAGGAVIELVDIDNLQLALDVPERYFAGLAVGEEVTVTFAALDGYEVAAAVRAVVPQADPEARTFPVKLAVSNKERRLGVGMLGRARLPVGAEQQAVLVPKDAVVSRGPQAMVFVVDEESNAQIVPVSTGGAIGEWISVLGGAVQPGSRVIVRGNERLQPGQQVAGESIEHPLP